MGLNNKIYKYNKEEVKNFLRESNAIEMVYDEYSLERAGMAWRKLAASRKLDESMVLSIHKTLMMGSILKPEERGSFRRVRVWVGGAEGLDWNKISEAIKHWTMNVMDLIKNGKGEDPVYLERIIKKHHVEYEKIHPFLDGNGRTGRMFMNWERMQLKLPILTIKADWPKEDGEQRSYYSWFREEL